MPDGMISPRPQPPIRLNRDKSVMPEPAPPGLGQIAPYEPADAPRARCRCGAYPPDAAHMCEPDTPRGRHHCDDRCICPIHQTPLYYAPQDDTHACQDPTCVHAHGMVYAHGMPNPDKYGFESVRVMRLSVVHPDDDSIQPGYAGNAIARPDGE
jgi:hypothetical protein